ncbi:hypothetical protein FBY04_11116 [Pseudomonas sp. SJZ080]|nr:hypothetical protein FBY04_11116 [Pseudomonas sp. SJZ080]
MSRSLGLREDQRVGEVLATLVCGLFPVDPVWCIREQARSHKGSLVNTKCMFTTDQHVGAAVRRFDLLAKRPVQSVQI